MESAFIPIVFTRDDSVIEFSEPHSKLMRDKERERDEESDREKEGERER